MALSLEAFIHSTGICGGHLGTRYVLSERCQEVPTTQPSGARGTPVLACAHRALSVTKALIQDCVCTGTAARKHGRDKGLRR